AAPVSAGPCPAVPGPAWSAARAALRETPRQLAELSRAGVVDAGGYGLVTVLGALVGALSGERPADPVAEPAGCGPAAGTDGTEEGTGAGADTGAGPETDGPAPDGGPAYEVIYLLEAGDEAVAALRSRLDALGDSLVVVGGDGLWNVHVHVDDPGAAVEAGIEAGRPFRIRITHFGGGRPAHRGRDRAADGAVSRAVVAVVPGDGLAALCAAAGAAAVTVRPGEPPASGELAQALRRAGAGEVVLLPNDPELRHTAAAAAEQARAEGLRVAIIPTRSPVQGLAALAVHEPARRFDEDVVAMTSAAGATRYGELCVAERQSWTTAGVCQAGDVLGLIDGDVALIGTEPERVAAAVLDRMLSAGGELVTLVVGADAPEGLAGRLERHVRRAHLAVDTVVYEGRQSGPLLIGVE
ncbi:dihydroxyacetone kinase, partial [Streptomyces sp. TRM 70361]|uniref:DAK2 domain-containing protein n=1 Tax=Streptomyces sp. TRM 70361 TaxID=3116553 RepID=UPI002E7C4741